MAPNEEQQKIDSTMMRHRLAIARGILPLTNPFVRQKPFKPLKQPRWFATKRQQRIAKQRGTLVATTTEPTSLVSPTLEEHRQWLKSQEFSLDKPPPFAADPSGIVGRDLTDEIIDMKDLYDPRIHSATAPDWQAEGYEPSTPLTEELIAHIAVRGVPISVAEFMRQALTHPLHGYYTHPTNDDNIWDDDDDEDLDPVTPDRYILGSRGDFVTAPEISQVFGECLAIWFITQWQVLNKPNSIQLIEVGPGRGTLICDILRCILTFVPDCGAAIKDVHLIEASQAMRDEQRRSLEALKVDDVGFVFDDNDDNREPVASDGEEQTNKIRVRWHDSFPSMVAKQASDDDDAKMPSFVVCQELLDALPVHVFQRTESGWRERLVDVAVKKDEDDDEEEEDTAEPDTLKTRLRATLATGLTPACSTLLNVDESGNMMNDQSSVGDVCEVCPEGIFLVQDIAKLIERNSGGALIIDYGQEGSKDSVRGFSKHKQVNFLSKPGEVDVTADVDFAALRHAVNARERSDNDNTHAFGPVTQGEFLAAMGALERVTALIEDDETTEEQAQNLYDALERLVLPEHMGERYKVLAIGRKKEGIFAPPGFQ